jgi:murein DD-endopeptidase MepM/ murein hydrolase activator NlpD
MDALARSVPLLPLSSPALDRASTAAPSNTAEVAALAQEFESLLLLQVMRQLRQTLTTLGGDDDKPMGGGFGAMTDTIDAELARYLSKAGGLGLGRYLASALGHRGPDVSGAGTMGKRNAVPVEGASEPADIAEVAPSAEGRSPLAGGLQRPARQGTHPGSAEAEAHVHPTGPTAAATLDAEPRLAVAGAITSGFGWRRDPFVHTARFHAGVDLRAAYGENVPTAGDGQVVFAGEQGAYGLTVVVEHAGGLRTRYAHLSAISVQVGDNLEEGEAIGRAGQTGRATAPHVHFELMRDGQRLDPSALVRSPRAFKSGQAVADYASGSPSVTVGEAAGGTPQPAASTDRRQG